MNTYRRVVLPLLYGVAAVLVSIAAIAVIVVQVRGGDDDDANATAARFSLGEALRDRFDNGDAVPSLRGFGLDALPAELARTYLGVSVGEADGAVVVQSVLPGGPAAEAGVQPGDTVRAVNGTAVASVDELRTALAAIADGDEYAVDITRDGAEQSVTVQRMSLEDALRAGIGRTFERFRDRSPHVDPSATPAPQT